jgi:hypothetical protein
LARGGFASFMFIDRLAPLRFFGRLRRSLFNYLIYDLIIGDHENGSRTFTDILYPARARQLCAYDAAHVDLAIRRGLPLVCLDGKLKAAASAVDVAPMLRLLKLFELLSQG